MASGAARLAGLAPDRLAATTEAAAQALLRQGEATNTRLSYSSAMRYWCAWFAARYGQSLALPVPVPVVVQFIVDHAARRPEEAAAQAGPSPEGEEVCADEGRGLESAARTVEVPLPRAGDGAQRRCATTTLVTELPPDVDAALVAGGYKGKPGPPALATLVHRIAVLSKAHQMALAGRTGDGGFAQNLVSPAAGRRRAVQGAHAIDEDSEAEGRSAGAFTNPCADPLVRELLARTRRAYAQRGVRPQKQRALTRDPMQQMLATCDESMKGIRDRALLLFAWSTGGRRRSEVASAQLAHLHRLDADSFVYVLGHSKTNQRGEQRPEDAKPLVGSAAQAMQAWLAVLAGEGVKEGAIFRRIRRGGHLGEPLAAAAVREIVKERCALAGIEGPFSAHSLRAGFVTEAGRQAIPMAETMALTGHQSVASVVGYFRSGATASQLRSLLDDRPEDSA